MSVKPCLTLIKYYSLDTFTEAADSSTLKFVRRWFPSIQSPKERGCTGARSRLSISWNAAVISV